MPATKNSPPPFQTAKVTQLATQEEVKEGSNSKIEKRVLDRIQKCLQRAKHPNTPESEAQAAWRMTSRLMAQYNVTQADLLEQATEDSDYASMGGQSVVAITSTKGSGSKVVFQTWVGDVVSAMMTFFDCSSYSTQRSSSIEWTFYGIAPNTIAAATAFEMAHNLILEWARSKIGKNVKNCYCLGVGKGLSDIAKAEKRKEEKDAKKQEEEQSQASGSEEVREHDPITTSSNSFEDRVPQDFLKNDNDVETESSNVNSPDNYDLSSDDENEDVKPTFIEAEEMPLDIDSDLENELHKTMLKQNLDTISPAATAPKVENESQVTVNPWASSQALVKFRSSAKKVAEEFLKAQNVKLGKGRKRHVAKGWNSAAYSMGVEDSKKIDVKRRRIEES